MTDVVHVVEAGTRHVHWTKWSLFLREFLKTIPGITSHHHFKVSKEEPRIVTDREYANSPEETINIFKKRVSASSLKVRKPTSTHPKVLMPNDNGICVMKYGHFALQTSLKTLHAQCPQFQGLVLLQNRNVRRERYNNAHTFIK